MGKVVVDSSVIVKWLNQKDESYLKQAEAVLKDASDGKIELLAPEIAKYEVGNALLAGKKLSYSEGKEALDLLFSLPLSFYLTSFELAQSSYLIADMAGITYYDASFIALAKEEQATLVTDNPKHQGKKLGVKVVPLSEY